MRVDPLMHLSQAITSVFEAIVYTSMLVLVAVLVVAGALELRSRMRRPEHTRNTGARAHARAGDSRAPGGRVAPVAR
jgi:hypothetical protein